MCTLSQSNFYFSVRYLQKLPCDKFTKLAPFFTVYKQRKNAPRSTRVRVPKNERPPRDDDEEEKKFEYTCELDLPIVCPVKETIEVGTVYCILHLTIT